LRRFLHFVATATALVFATDRAQAQSYLTRPITLIVPASAGGPTDVVGRILAEAMRASLSARHHRECDRREHQPQGATPLLVVVAIAP
jgi:tripartite-type tricarboxylate transporter receptor subunit TctC